MRMKIKYFLPLILVIFMLGSCAFTAGQKPIVSMDQVKELTPRKLADYAISIYNKRADWYKAQLSMSANISKEQMEELINEYNLLVNIWPVIDLYDRTIISGEVPDADLQIEIYKFIQRYLGGE